MRVISGTAKGHSLRCLKGIMIRPTQDRVREAVFNVLGSRVKGARFLDVFAGTGAIGIEALSRGAKLCFFNDKSPKACRIIKENLVHCGLEEKAKIYNMEAERFVKTLIRQGEIVFDLIYLDPPYGQKEVEQVLAILGTASIINEDTVIIVETGNKTGLNQRFADLAMSREDIYGDTTIRYYNIIN